MGRFCHDCAYFKNPTDSSSCSGCFGVDGKPNWRPEVVKADVGGSMDKGCHNCKHGNDDVPFQNCKGCLTGEEKLLKWEPIQVVPGDNVNYPPHYNTSQLEPIVAIEEWKLNFRLGNVIKYVARHKHKNGLEDLKKALYYLDREIAQYERDV